MSLTKTGPVSNTTLPNPRITRTMTDDDPRGPEERLADLAHLSAGIGHHVINAFSAIVSNAEILKLSAQMPEAVDPLTVADVIVKTALGASSVARRLIDFTRPITTINFESTDLRKLLAEIVAHEREKAPAGVRWVEDLKPVPPVSANGEQLKAMLGHLIENAYEALSGRGGEISLSTAVDPRGWVVMELADNGPGMTEEVHKHAVEPFFTTKAGRFGVGLTIANGIWRRHKGTLGVLTHPGEGVRVRLFIEPEGHEPKI